MQDPSYGKPFQSIDFEELIDEEVFNIVCRDSDRDTFIEFLYDYEEKHGEDRHNIGNEYGSLYDIYNFIELRCKTKFEIVLELCDSIMWNIFKCYGYRTTEALGITTKWCFVHTVECLKYKIRFMCKNGIQKIIIYKKI